MEAKLAKYRAKKAKECRSTGSILQRFLGVFKRLDVDGSKARTGRPTDLSRPTDSTESQQASPGLCVGSSNDSRTEQESEEEIEPPPAPGKYRWLLFALKTVLWLIMWLVFVEVQFGAVFFVVSALLFVYVNTRTGKKDSKNSLSAYSVFNPNCHRLQGTITAEQFEAELLHRKPLSQS